ncbi:hypothetical protein FO519_000559 [Halicephalobus sp. NKZ332]|nr:hypothetical protein FO519_000559 [Halicephalobus sp. NKZ332]
MSVSIQDCASLSAEERRQRRKERILGRGEERISQILHDTPSTKTGTNAEEVSFVSSVSAEEPSTANPEQKVTSQESDFDYVEPEYWIGIDYIRAQAFLIIGILLHVLSSAGVLKNGFLVWLIGFFTFHTIHFLYSKQKYPKHGYVVNFLLAGGMNEALVRYAGLFVDTAWVALLDTAVMLLGVVITECGSKMI